MNFLVFVLVSRLVTCTTNRIGVFFSILLIASCALGQQPLTADEIMARVAANQDQSVQQRAHYVYKQHIHSTSHKTNGKLMREETDDFDVFPTPTGTERKLQSLAGRYWKKGKYVDFRGEPIPDADSLDADLTHDTFNQSGNKGKEGYLSNLFPLTTEKQKDYEFKLLGEQEIHGRLAYHLSFGPKDKKEIDWAGEAFIDKEDLQPVNVFTKMSRKLPFFVRSVMGVDVPGVGFNVQYTRQEAGVWFPESFGTEFELHLFHVMSRAITISLKNSDFRKTHVETKIEVPGSKD